MFNVFEKVAAEIFQGLPHVRTTLEQTTGSRAHLAGSGPCMYALLDSEPAARQAALSLQSSGRQAFVARTVNTGQLAPEAT